MDRLQRSAWFERQYGRKPRNDAELEGGMLHQAVLKNAEHRATAERVVAYAESAGGDTLAYAKALFGWYWGPLELVSPFDAARVAGLPEDRADDLLAEILRAAKGSGGTGPAEACRS